jgi:succinoglycan biosynthesis protein ExoA
MINTLPPNTPRRIVVAIPTLNEEAHIAMVVLALAQEKPRFPDMSIVIADGGSQDRTREIVHVMSKDRPYIYWLDNPKKIQSAGINLVAQQWASRADILVRCDAHSLYPENFLSDLIRTINETNADSVVVVLDTQGKNCVQRSVAMVSNSPLGTGGSAHRGGRKSDYVDHGHHAAFNLKRFLSLGGYDESFSHNEDGEYDCRLIKSNGKVYLNADIRVGYVPRSTLPKLFRQYYNYGKGRARTIKKHPRSLRLRQLLVPMHLVISLISIIIAACLQNPLFLAWPIFYVTVLILNSLITPFTQRSLCGALTGISAFVMHTAWGLGFLRQFLLGKTS